MKNIWFKRVFLFDSVSDHFYSADQFKREKDMQVWRKDGGTVTVETREPHVYDSEHKLVTFLREHLMKEPYGHWLVFTGAEERILGAQMKKRFFVAQRPYDYLDNMVLSLLRADGMKVRPCLVGSIPSNVAGIATEHLAIACNMDL
jgi:hypothetical protein